MPLALLRSRRSRRAVAAAATALGATAALTLGAGPAQSAAPAGPAAAAHPGRLDRVFIIMIENHDRNGVIGNPAVPYLTSLARRYGVATNYYGVTHPSLPNYIAATSGSNWDTYSDDPALRFTHTNIVDQLERTGHNWAAYMESMPTAGYLGDYWPSRTTALYANKHNPFILYTDIRNNPARRAQIKPYTRLAADLATAKAPQYVWITPNQCNDMHGGVTTKVAGHPETPCPYPTKKGDAADQSLKRKADAFLKRTVQAIMGSKAWTKRSAIFIVADEGDYTGVAANGGWESPAGCCDSPYLPAGDPRVSPSWPGGVYGGGKVPAVVITGAGPRHIVDSTPYNHYSLLRTVENAFGLTYLGYASDGAQVRPMTRLIARK